MDKSDENKLDKDGPYESEETSDTNTNTTSTQENKLDKDGPYESEETSDTNTYASDTNATSTQDEEEKLQASPVTSFFQNISSKLSAFSLEGMLTRFRNLNSDTKQELQDLDEGRLTLEKLVTQMKEGHFKRIITLVGAGISTSAGIPDFRSPGSGLYNNLAKYNLPNAQAIFEYDYFVENPVSFFALAKEIIPCSFKPTKAHYFIRLLHEKKILLRHYTQNIDNLDRQAGIPELKLVEAHGTFNTSHCIDCAKLYSLSWMKEHIVKFPVPSCEDCGGIVKPDIILFGESLPSRFFSSVSTDFKECDLLIIMGTSLNVEPFASIVRRVADKCPRIIINNTEVGQNVGISYKQGRKSRDFFLKTRCDEGCQKLVEMLGWEDGFEKLLEEQKNVE